MAAMICRSHLVFGSSFCQLFFTILSLVLLGAKGVVGPAWTHGEMEMPEEEKDMGGWKTRVYSTEQQSRLGVDEYGDPLPVKGTSVSEGSENSNNEELSHMLGEGLSHLGEGLSELSSLLGGLKDAQVDGALGKIGEAFGQMVCTHEEFTAASQALSKQCGESKMSDWNQETCLSSSCQAALCRVQSAMRNHCGESYSKAADKLDLEFKENCNVPLQCSTGVAGSHWALLVVALVIGGLTVTRATKPAAAPVPTASAEELRRRRLERFGEGATAGGQATG